MDRGNGTPKEHNLWASCLHLERKQRGTLNMAPGRRNASEKDGCLLNQGPSTAKEVPTALAADKPHQLELILATRTESGHGGLRLTGQEITWAVLFCNLGLLPVGGFGLSSS